MSRPTQFVARKPFSITIDGQTLKGVVEVKVRAGASWDVPEPLASKWMGTLSGVLQVVHRDVLDLIVEQFGLADG